MTEIVSSWFLALFRNAAYRESLRGPGAELEGGLNNLPPPPHQVVENLESQQGAG